ncbi:hypothetical protein [Pedobacter nyackensis]|uniref:hypothetical protein n=1 Tax=Pedobacter nyackensis TaxID=475255 RepID=UPI002930A962|nr:hypothetical protein [Pedobacter nyackensis]
MKTHTTTTLQKLVLEHMSPGGPGMNNAEIADWMERIPKITDDMLKIMSSAVFSLFPNKLTHRHLNQILKECTLLLDALHGYGEDMGNMQKLALMVRDCLLEIIELLWLRYSKYLDADVKMPKLLFCDAARQIERNAALMVTAMTRYHADKRLQAVVLCKMTGLLKDGSGSWHKIEYLEKLHRCIMELCTGSNCNITSKLRQLLLRANFNTSGFIAYCKAGIDTELAENYEVKDQFHCMYVYQREFSCPSYMHKFTRFAPREPKVKEVLLAYVNSELTMMEKKNRPAAVKKVIEQPVAVERYKLPMSISVDAMVYFFRLLLTAGVTTATKNELLLFLSKSFRTVEAGDQDISLKSLNNKCRQVVKNTAITVKSILLNMLKQVDGEFG